MALETGNKDKYGFFYDITGIAMKVHNKFGIGLLESAYEAGLKYLLKQYGYKVEQQVFLPMYWDDVQLEQHYRMDLVVNQNIIVELKAVPAITREHIAQTLNYVNLTHSKLGYILNFSQQEGRGFQRLLGQAAKGYEQ